MSSLPRLLSAGVAVVVAVALAGAPASAAATVIDLGTADAFAVLAGSGITNTGATTITGDVGTFPTPSMTGFGTVVLGGQNHGGDTVTEQAKKDLTTAYDQAFASGPAGSVATELGSTVLTPGVYHGDTLEITGTLTLDTQGDPQAVFVLQAATTLVTASASKVVVLGASSACNVFWQIGSSATLGSDSTLVGSVLAAESITANDGAAIEGRLLANGGAVTLHHNTITARTCAAAAPAGSTTPTTPSTTVTPTAGPTGAVTTATPTTPGAATTPPGGSTTTLTELPRTGPNDGLVPVGLLSIAVGILLVRLGTPKVALLHAVRPRHRRTRD